MCCVFPWSGGRRRRRDIERERESRVRHVASVKPRREGGGGCYIASESQEEEELMYCTALAAGSGHVRPRRWGSLRSRASELSLSLFVLLCSSPDVVAVLVYFSD